MRAATASSWCGTTRRSTARSTTITAFITRSWWIDKDYKPALDNLRANGVEVLFEEDRQGGVVNGPRAYFRDPDGTVLEYIDLTSYAGAKR